MKPLITKLPSHIKDTSDFLNKLLNLRNLPSNTLLVTLDVSSLYTNIPHNDGINACRFFLHRSRNNRNIPTETLCDLIRMVLTMNNFMFNGKNFLQIHGTAMGTKMAPSFANLFLGQFESNALSNSPFKPHTWWRYIDDIFMIWTEGLENLNTFVNYLNNLHPTIKFTSNHSFTNIPFLDVMVSLKDGLIETDLYTKPTDKHQYLFSSSCHPHHTKKGIPFGLALRLRRICSTDNTFYFRTKELTSFLIKRGYKHAFIEQQIARATSISRSDALQYNRRKTSNRTPFILTYNPSLPSISSIIQKHFNLLQSSNRCKNTFKEPPVVAYRRSPNLRDLLIRAQLPSNRTNSNYSTPGSFRCGCPNCLTCPYISEGLTQYTFFSTGEKCCIKSHLNCNTKNLIYMIQCNRCQLQYIGETKRSLKDRFNEHRRTVDNPHNKSSPTTAGKHFLLTPNHSSNDMQLIPIEKIFNNRDAVRKAREAHLILRANTLEPYGLNIREDL